MRARTLLIGLALLAGCDGQDDIDRLARVGRKVGDKVRDATADKGGPLSGPLQSVRGNWNEMTLDARVGCRLLWDKELEGAEVTAHATGHGVVELRGSVTSPAQRQRALALARSTVGVADVADKMTQKN